ncbi:LptE family protein [Porphyromonas sp.]|uniref:LptE family protein n=1 Tax=Porphyromonas sp. TaxID=1924944 RepID=UPI0026DAD05D|nr:LptE family protein [Porphyromonas sp.]MDO4770759.1 LptE family protein [Porphyromonas sp.]
MTWIKRINIISIAIFLVLSVTSCIVSYKLNGASIDYNRIKTVTIRDFSNLAPLVYPPLAQKFTEDLRENFQRRTRLNMQPAGGDLNIEGEIVGYDLAAEAVQEDAYSAKTRFTLRIKVRYTNRINPDEDFEREFSSFTTFDSNILFTDVQDGLCKELTEDIIQQIFNATVENW